MEKATVCISYDRERRKFFGEVYEKGVLVFTTNFYKSEKQVENACKRKLLTGKG